MNQISDSYACVCHGAKYIRGSIRGKEPLSKVLKTALFENKFISGGGKLLLNSGIWYNPAQRIEYSAELVEVRKILSKLKNKNPTLEIIWFETTAQHFCFPGGTYKVQKGEKFQGISRRKTPVSCCEILAPNEFRQKLSHKILLKHLNIRVFDAFTLTKNWSDHHPGGGDCTHFCSEPGGALETIVSKLFDFLSRKKGYEEKM